MEPRTEGFNRLSHAYITSPELASIVAMSAVCSSGTGEKPCRECNNCKKAQKGIHPDIITVTKPEDKRDIIVDQIRALKKTAIEIPNDAGKKVYIVEDAGLMNINAQNAFLQLLEEPPGHAVFVLSTDTPAALLPTVRSRCVLLKAPPQEPKTDESASETAQMFFSAMERGNEELARFMFQLEKLDKINFEAFLASAQKQAVSQLRTIGTVSNAGIPAAQLLKAYSALKEAAQMLDLNVSTGHIAGLLCATLIEIDN
ncbi:MAG: DNA polymerase III subunit [Oscillospiraceae bacterium]|nr:DNA polymerase III subunit [Oscillospiraceae bacterium]